MALSFFSVVGAGGLAWWGYSALTAEFPEVGVLKSQYPRALYRGKDRHFDVQWSKSRPIGWSNLGEISKSAIGAVIVSEDGAFFQHKGYDALQIKEAIEEDWRAPGKMRGASTITQQVVKNVFLTSERSLWRKVKELWLAIRLENSVSKHRILETYLNIAEWGEGIFGITDAAQSYFGKRPAELTAREGAFLAMLLPSPKRYSQSFRQKQLTSYASHTIRNILGKMEKAGYLTPEARVSEVAAQFSFEQKQPEAGNGEDLDRLDPEIEAISKELPGLGAGFEDSAKNPDGLTRDP